MPKAKPTQVIVHRIELQETERATLEAALAGNFVTNAVSAAGSVFSGIGQALAPFSGVLTAIGAAYIAEKGISEIVEAAKVVKENIPTFDPRNQNDAYTFLISFLQANPDWDKLGGKLSQLKKDLEKMKASPLLLLKLQQWSKYVISQKNQTGGWPNYSPAKSFLGFYSPKEFAQDQLQILNLF
jgi:hypothetical protein